MQYKHSYKFSQHALSALAVCNTGVQRCEGGYSWGPGVRDHYLMHYVMAGRGSYQVGSRTYALAQGDLFLVQPDENIFYQADLEEPWEYCWVGFRGAEARLLLEQTDLCTQRPVLYGVSGEIYRQMVQIYENGGSLPHQAASMKGALYQLLAILMRDCTAPAVRRERDSVARGCEYIENNFAMPISVEDVAAHVGLSRSQLYRLFVAELNRTPMQVLTQVRIRQACALLRRGDLSVKAVAASVGFDNQMYFSRRFREVVGVPPSQYAPDEENRAEHLTLTRRQGLYSP